MFCTVVAVELVRGESVDLLDRAEDVGRAHDLVAAHTHTDRNTSHRGQEKAETVNRRFELGLIKDLWEAKARRCALLWSKAKGCVYLWMISFSNTVPNTSPPAITCVSTTPHSTRQTRRVI